MTPFFFCDYFEKIPKEKSEIQTRTEYMYLVDNIV